MQWLSAASGATFVNQPEREKMIRFELKKHAASLLPEGKEWKLVWHDEFDGVELDRSKWDFRLNFWGRRLKTFTEEGVELDGDSHLRLHLIRIRDDYYSPHLQTGSLTYDMPRDTDGIWPFGKRAEPKFMHRYGYYEIRCRLPRIPGWHAAFWLQAPGVGSHPDARRAGVECDIMENYRQHTESRLIAGNLWGGYGVDHGGSGHFSWECGKDDSEWHSFGVDWSPEGYAFYADGRLTGRVVPPEMAHQKKLSFEEMNGKKWLRPGSVAVGPVSETEQFLLVSTECHGYRGPGFTAPAGHPADTPVPLLARAKLPDFFEVDHVRVFDELL